MNRSTDWLRLAYDKEVSWDALVRAAIGAIELSEVEQEVPEEKEGLDEKETWRPTRS